MGGTSAYKLCQILDNCEYVLAIEMLIAAQAIDFNFDTGLKLSQPTEKVYRDLRAEIPFLEHDRVMADDIEKAVQLLRRKGAGWVSSLNQ